MMRSKNKQFEFERINYVHKVLWASMLNKIADKGIIIHPDNWFRMKKIETQIGIPLERWGKLTQSA